MTRKLEPRVYTLDEISEEEFTTLLLAEDWPEWTPSEQFARDQGWIEEHMAEFVQEYPDQWIAVYDQKVVAASPDPKVVEQESDYLKEAG